MDPKTPRKRIDVLLVERGLVSSRARAQATIDAGDVRVDGQRVTKASAFVAIDATLEVVAKDHPYVSRGGLKLEGALHDLGVSPHGLVVADIGASTGGFTDCVLRRGALRVYAVDVGHGQLHPALRADPRVFSMEGVNARELTAASLPERPALVLVDASFIGLAKLLPALACLLAPGGQLLTLVKPQFEVGRAGIGKRGVVHDDALREDCVVSVVAAAASEGFALSARADCRLPGPEGNREVFALFRRL